MAGNVKLMTSAGGGVILDTATTTATDVTVKVPTRDCTLLGDGASQITSQTAKTATGTSIDFTGIPSWVKRITVMFNGVSTNGTSVPLIQIGDSGGIETTGYFGASTGLGGSALTTQNFTNGFGLRDSWAASFIVFGAITLTNITGNSWVVSGSLGHSDTTRSTVTAGGKVLSDVLSQVRITTVNGTDTFDAGSINIMYE